MPQNHMVGRRDPIHGQSGRLETAWWALRPTGKVLFFIHGFGGKATGTWRQFPKLLANDNDFAGWDLCFYQYESRRRRGFFVAQELYQYLQNFVSQPRFANADLDSAHERPDSFTYSEIWIVTHSLGAPLARRAMLTAQTNGAGWLAHARLVCFAPASTGADILLLLQSVGYLSFTASMIRALLRFRWQILGDLIPNSQFLQSLLSDTLAIMPRAGQPPFTSDVAVFGDNERIVTGPPFFQFDPNIVTIFGCNHGSVCKPNLMFDQAYTNLKSIAGAP